MIRALSILTCIECHGFLEYYNLDKRLPSRDAATYFEYDRTSMGAKIEGFRYKGIFWCQKTAAIGRSTAAHWKYVQNFSSIEGDTFLAQEWISSRRGETGSIV